MVKLGIKIKGNDFLVEGSKYGIIQGGDKNKTPLTRLMKGFGQQSLTSINNGNTQFVRI